VGTSAHGFRGVVPHGSTTRALPHVSPELSYWRAQSLVWSDRRLCDLYRGSQRPRAIAVRARTLSGVRVEARLRRSRCDSQRPSSGEWGERLRWRGRRTRNFPCCWPFSLTGPFFVTGGSGSVRCVQHYLRECRLGFPELVLEHSYRAFIWCATYIFVGVHTNLLSNTSHASNQIRTRRTI
jgi:hypothetical protein